MVGASLFSLVLLVGSGAMLDAHRREWRTHRASASVGRSDRRRLVRRTVATSTIAAVGVLVALWPVTPREPAWVVAYAATLFLLAVAILALGLADAIASAGAARRDSRRRLESLADLLGDPSLSGSTDRDRR